jgi:hypothetical protein
MSTKRRIVIAATSTAFLLCLLFPSWKVGFKQGNGEWLTLTGGGVKDDNVRAFLFTGPSLQSVPHVSISSTFPVTFGWRLNVTRLLMECGVVLVLGTILSGASADHTTI